MYNHDIISVQSWRLCLRCRSSYFCEAYYDGGDRRQCNTMIAVNTNYTKQLFIS